MLNPYPCSLSLKLLDLYVRGSFSFDFVDPLSSPRHQKHINDSDTEVKPRPIEVDVTKVDWY